MILQPRFHFAVRLLFGRQCFRVQLIQLGAVLLRRLRPLELETVGSHVNNLMPVRHRNDDLRGC